VLSFLGLDEAQGDKCLGMFHLGQATAATMAKYKGRRGEWQGKVTFKQ
jgi:hypothetical protein